MEIRGSSAYPPTGPGPVVTIGNFDGVHRGHRALIERARSLAAPDGLPVCAYTFDPAPRDVLRPDNDVPRIQTLSDRVATLRGAGVDQVVVEPFDRAFAARPPEWFASVVLADRLRAAAVVVGWDFRFGRARRGNPAVLAEHLRVPVVTVDAVVDDDGVVSSSRIRRAVREGRVEAAAAVLGRPHEVVGTVVEGARRGRLLGFPTANIAPQTPLLPALGVYAVRVEVDGVELGGVANVGRRPTFDDGPVQLEVHLLDWEGDLYGRPLRAGFVGRLRGEQRFAGPEALVAQIDADIDTARRRLARS